MYALLLTYSIVSLNTQTDKNIGAIQQQLGVPMPRVLYEIGAGKNTTTSIAAILGFASLECTGCAANFGVYPIVSGQYR